MSKKTVLLVEGNPDDELLALYALKENGLGGEEVAVARDGAEALEYLFGARAGRGADGLPELVLLDQRLPGVDGPEVLRRLSEDDRTASLPVVLLTADHLLHAPGEYGARALLRKPLTPEKLAEAAWKAGVRDLLFGEASPQEKQAVISRPIRAVPRGAKVLRVLLVEDSEDDVSLILRALRRGGYEPLYRRVQTRAGMEAALADEWWDVVVSDYHLPDFGAMEALEVAKKSGMDLPFVVVSGKIGEDVAVGLMRAGAHDYVLKTNLYRLCPAVEREVREARGRRERVRAEAALRESEHRFRALVQNSSDVTVVLDARGTILYESPAVERVLGYAPEERVGRKILDLVHPDDLGRFSDAFARFLEGPDVLPPVEYRARHKDGSWRHFEAVGKNLLSDPIVNGVVINFRDVTERRMAEEELERRARLLDLDSDAILVRDLQDRITFWNRGAEELYGWKSEEALGKVSHELLKTRLSEPLEQVRSELLRRGVWEGELSHTKRDNTTIVTASRWALQRDGRGEPAGVLENNADVTERKRAVEELRQSEERFRGTFEQAAVGVAHVGADGRWLRVNEKLCEISGYEEGELLGMSFQDITHPDDLGADLDKLERLIAGEIDTYSVEKRYLRKDGSVVWVEVTSSLARAPSGEPEYRIAVVEDITQRKRSEEALRRSEARRFAVVDTAFDAIVTMASDGNIESFNRGAESTFGYTAKEAIGQPLTLLMPERFRKAHVAGVRRYLRTGASRLVGQRRIELTGRRKNGEEFPLELSLAEVPQRGDPLFSAIIRDISERKRAEEILRRSEERYRAVVEQAGEGIFLFDARTKRILEANLAFGEMFGYTREELARMKVYDLIPHDPEGVDRNVRSALEQRSIQVGEREYRRKDGSRIDVEVSGSVISYGGGEVICSVVRDVTERKRAEQALKESEERFRSLVQNASDVVAILEADGVVRYESPAIERVLGYKPKEVVGKNALDYVHPEDLEHLSGVLGEEVPNSRGRQTNLEFRFRHADGSWRYLEAVVNNLLDDPSLAGIVLNSRDVTERKMAEESLRQSFGMLLALYQASQILTSTLDLEERGTKLLEIMHRVSGLTVAAVNLRDEGGQPRLWKVAGPEDVWGSANDAPEARAARRLALAGGGIQVYRLRASGPQTPPVGLCLPLRAREQVIGTLDAFGPEALAEKRMLDALGSLAGLAGSALENARLYGELAEREHRLEDLVGKLMTAQEEERRRVAYEVHDGLAQVAAAAYQHLQAFARFYPPDSEEGRKILHRALELVQRTVGDARRIIANLRPTALDDFGLRTAVRLEVEALRAEDWRVGFEGSLRDDERLPFAVETALFRIVQEALTNVRKHARTKQVRLTLDRLGESVRLSVRDWGRGFDPAVLTNSAGPGERIGLSSMRERVAVLGGDFRIDSSPGAGTAIMVEVPLAKRREADRERGDSGQADRAERPI